MPDKSIAVRAFELARDGSCRSRDDIRRKLTAEGFESVDAHLAGTTIRKQLAAALAEPRS